MEGKDELNEGLFGKVIDLVFFGGINKIIDDAEEAVGELDPKARAEAEETFDQLEDNAKELNQRMKRYCKKYPDSDLCKKWKEQGGLGKARW